MGDDSKIENISEKIDINRPNIYKATKTLNVIGAKDVFVAGDAANIELDNKIQI